MKLDFLSSKAMQQRSQLENEGRRLQKTKDQLIGAIDKLRKTDQDSEIAARKEKRQNDLQEFKNKENQLTGARKVSEDLVVSLRNAVAKYKSEAQSMRNELSKIQREAGIFCYLILG